jgi:hypothetical protein
MHAAIQTFEQLLHDYRAHAGMAERENVRAQHHDRPRINFTQRLTHAGGMTSDEVDLKLADAVRRYQHFGEGTEAGIDALNDAPVAYDAFDDCARCLDAAACGIIELDADGPGTQCDALDIGKRHCAADDHGIVHGAPR